MAKQKYYYAIVDKENGDFARDYSSRINAKRKTLPIYFERSDAEKWLKNDCDTKKYIIHKINIPDLEGLVLKSKKA